MSLRPLHSVVLLAALCACQSQAPPALNFTDYLAAFNQAMGAYFQRCGIVDASRVALVAQTPLLAVAPELQQAIDAEVRFGRAALTTGCFAPLASASCDISQAYAAIQACTTFGQQYLPQVPLGDLCHVQGECIGGYCDLGAVKRPCGTGVCTPYLPAGTQCGVGVGACDPATATCWQGECRQRGGPGSACLSDADCDLQSTCHTINDNGTTSRYCAARQQGLGVGALCDAGQSPDGCSSGARCVAPTPGMSPVCVRSKVEGSACYSTLECQGTNVCVGADPVRMLPGDCLHQGLLGESCAATGAVCQLTLFCDPIRKICQPASAVGQPCVQDPLAPGQSCLSGQCLTPAGGVAGQGVCQDRVDDGQPCRVGTDCQSGVCNSGGVCVAVCAPLQ